MPYRRVCTAWLLLHRCTTQALMEKLLELDDVDAVFTNCEGLTA